MSRDETMKTSYSCVIGPARTAQMLVPTRSNRKDTFWLSISLSKSNFLIIDERMLNYDALRGFCLILLLRLVESNAMWTEINGLERIGVPMQVADNSTDPLTKIAFHFYQFHVNEPNLSVDVKDFCGKANIEVL